MSVDYELLGGLIGSAWNENRTKGQVSRAYAGELATMLNTSLRVPVEQLQKFENALWNTMRGRCVTCGVETTNRWSSGVICCPACAIQKAECTPGKPYQVKVGEKVLVVRSALSEDNAISQATTHLSGFQPGSWYEDEPKKARLLGPDDTVVWL